MFNKRVSVIIPIYNVSNYVDATIESACQQSYSNIEIILVNDGSTDDCGKKCDEWKQRDNRIKVIHQENGGLSSARNAGLNIATGDYIYFLDGDDYIKENLLEETIPYMDEGYDMVSFNYYKIYNDGTMVPSSYCDFAQYENDTIDKKQCFFIQKLLRYKIGFEACTRVFRKDIIDKYKIRFADNRVIFAEDVYFNLCYSAHCKRFINLDKILYYYRQHQTSIMSQEISKLNIGRMNELGKEVLKHYLEYDDCIDLIQIFPVIYYLIIDNVLSRYIRINQPRKRELRKAILEDINDIEFFKLQIGALKNYKKYLHLIYTNVQTEVVLSNLKYYLDGNWLTEVIRYQLIRIYSFIIRIYVRNKKGK